MFNDHDVDQSNLEANQADMAVRSNDSPFCSDPNGSMNQSNAVTRSASSTSRKHRPSKNELELRKSTFRRLHEDKLHRLEVMKRMGLTEAQYDALFRKTEIWKPDVIEFCDYEAVYAKTLPQTLQKMLGYPPNDIIVRLRKNGIHIELWINESEEVPSSQSHSADLQPLNNS